MLGCSVFRVSGCTCTLQAVVDAHEMKAMYDKNAADAAEAKLVFDAQLAKAHTDAAEMKAQLDKVG